jgi:hypothetical protein
MVREAYNPGDPRRKGQAVKREEFRFVPAKLLYKAHSQGQLKIS